MVTLIRFVLRELWPLLIIALGFGLITAIALAAATWKLLGPNVPGNPGPVELIIGMLMIMGTFGAIAVGLIFLIVLLSREAAAENRLSQSHQEQPWCNRSDWAAGYVANRQLRQACFWAVLAVCTNSLVWGISCLFLMDPANRKNAVVFCGILLCLTAFVLIGVGLGFYALWFAFESRRCTKARMRIIGAPFHPGGVVRGYVEGLDSALLNGPLCISLHCKAQRSTRRQFAGHEYGEVERYDHYFYHSTYVIDGQPRQPVSDQQSVPIRFVLPRVLPAPALTGPADWTISLSWKSWSRRYDLDFEIPVFPVSSANLADQRASLEFDDRNAGEATNGFPRIARVEPTLELITAHGGTLNMLSSTSWNLQLPRTGGAPPLVPGMTICALLAFGGGGMALGGLVGIAFGLIPIAAWFVVGGNQILRCDGQDLTYQVLNSLIWQAASIKLVDVKAFDCQQTERSTLGTGLFQITCDLKTGKRIILMNNAHSLLLARRLRKLLEQSLPAANDSQNSVP